MIVDKGGRPSAVDSDGGRGIQLFGMFTPIVLPVPEEPLGVGAHWTVTKRTNGITLASDARITSVRDGISTLEARLTITTGPYRLYNAKEPRGLTEYWAHDQHDVRLVIDPAPPVIGFHDEHVMSAFGARCEQGRVKVLGTSYPKSVTFVRNH